MYPTVKKTSASGWRCGKIRYQKFKTNNAIARSSIKLHSVLISLSVDPTMFANKVVLITGASSGIGADAARHMSTLSAELVLVGRNQDRLQQTADICRANSGLEPLTVIAELTKDEDVNRIVAKTKEHFGRLDVVVNCAGIAPRDNILDMDMDVFDKIMNTNTRPVVNLTRLALPMLIEAKGNIVNISSIFSVKPRATFLTDSISKAALDCFGRAIAVQLAPMKVRVNSIVLGYVPTRIQASSDPKVVRKFLETVPTKEAVQIEDVSKLIAYLASDDAKAITGHYVAIDGGFTAQ